jgi:hypothetical protein
LTKNNCTKEVENFIKLYLDNISLLKKTDTVCDGSFRNCVILIRPYTFYVTHSGGYVDLYGYDYTTEDILNYFMNNATKIFLNMSWTTKEDDDYEWSIWNDIDDDYGVWEG